MKIQNRKKSKKLTPVVIAAALLLAGTVALMLYFNRESPQNSRKPDASTDTSRESDDKQAQDIKENPDNKQEATNSDEPPKPTNDTTTGKQQVQMTSSYNMSEGNIYIRGGVNYPVTDGSCYAMLSGPSGKSMRKDTTLLQNPASSDCKTIVVPLSELAPGDWSFVLHYTSNNFQGLSNEVAFTI